MSFTRTLYGVGRQSAVGQAFTATVADTPRPGTRWRILRVVLTAPNYTTGALSARVFVAGSFVAGTNQGQADSASGSYLVNPGELVTVTWSPTQVPTIQQGNVALDVEVLP